MLRFTSLSVLSLSVLLAACTTEPADEATIASPVTGPYQNPTATGHGTGTHKNKSFAASTAQTDALGDAYAQCSAQLCHNPDFGDELWECSNADIIGWDDVSCLFSSGRWTCTRSVRTQCAVY